MTLNQQALLDDLFDLVNDPIDYAGAKYKDVLAEFDYPPMAIFWGFWTDDELQDTLKLTDILSYSREKSEYAAL